MERVVECLASENCVTFEDCLCWARRKFEDYFSNCVNAALHVRKSRAKVALRFNGLLILGDLELSFFVW